MNYSFLSTTEYARGLTKPAISSWLIDYTHINEWSVNTYLSPNFSIGLLKHRLDYGIR